jgi:hypothetical protein
LAFFCREISFCDKITFYLSRIKFLWHISCHGNVHLRLKRQSVYITWNKQIDTIGFFTLMIPEIANQEVKISSISKTCDMSDLNFKPSGQPHMLWKITKTKRGEWNRHSTIFQWMAPINHDSRSLQIVDIDDRMRDHIFWVYKCVDSVSQLIPLIEWSWCSICT